MVLSSHVFCETMSTAQVVERIVKPEPRVSLPGKKHAQLIVQMETEHKLSMILSGDCKFCISFTIQYNKFLEGKVRSIILDDLTNSSVRDMLDVWGIDELPALVQGGDAWKVHMGKEAFTEMQKHTGYHAESAVMEPGGTPLRELARKQCQAAVIHGQVVRTASIYSCKPIPEHPRN